MSYNNNVLNHQEDIVIINIHAPTKRALKWSNLTELKGNTDNSTIAKRLHYSTFSMNIELDRTRQRFSKETVNLNNTIVQLTRPDGHL